MDDEKSDYSKINKIGSLVKVELDWPFPGPFKSDPLEGYDEKNILNDEEQFLQAINSMSLEWFHKFPDCCDDHRKLSRLDNFDKGDYSYIPSQISNNIKYFAHALELFIDTKGGLNEIKDYMDYLRKSLGSPALGGHIFEQALKSLIEGTKLDTKEFSDDERLDLLLHLEPRKTPVDIKERDLELLCITFQKWLDAMPNIGQFKELKERFTGKIPINIFISESRFNRYLGATSFKTKSQEELLEFLLEKTNDILNLSRHDIQKEKYDKEKLLVAAEERLRIKLDQLLEKNYLNLEKAYLNQIENWLTTVIEFYQIKNQIFEEEKSQKLINTTETIDYNINDLLNRLEALQIEISMLCISNKISKWLESYLPSEKFKQLCEEIDKVNGDEEGNKKLLDQIISQMQVNSPSDYKVDGLQKKMESPEITVKHKLKVAIPLFLFTTYEVETELGAKQKVPKTLKELKALFIRQ